MFPFSFRYILILFDYYIYTILDISMYTVSIIIRNRGPSLSFCFSFIFSVQAMPAAAMPLQRKKSLPDVAQPIQLTATAPLSREEVSILSSMRREEIRRQIDESERLRANPLLYLVSPQVKVSVFSIYLSIHVASDVDNSAAVSKDDRNFGRVTIYFRSCISIWMRGKYTTMERSTFAQSFQINIRSMVSRWNAVWRCENILMHINRRYKSFASSNPWLRVTHRRLRSREKTKKKRLI